MKKTTLKKLLGALGLGLSLAVLTGCTANFCSDVDRAQMAYPYDQGVTVYCTENEYNAYKTENAKKIEYEESIGVAGKAFANNDTVYQYVPYEITSDGYVRYTAAKAVFLSDTILKNANSAGHDLPSLRYYAEIDRFVLNASVYLAEQADKGVDAKYDVVAEPKASDDFVSKLVLADASEETTVWSVNPYTASNSDAITTESKVVAKSVLRRFGHVKFSGEGDKLFANMNHWNAKLYQSGEAELGLYGVPTKDFSTYYQAQINNKVAQTRSCIATRDGAYGHYGTNANWEVNISRKDWSYAWSKGFLEGLLVFPVSWLVDTFAFAFDGSLSGMGQIWALVLVTIIVRGLLMLATFPSTMSQQKMQLLQPELSKIQQKYPNSNTNQAEKQRLAQEQMALYRRNKIHPMAQILVMVIQFPVFICVWSGLQGSAALSTGEILNMRLSDNINSILLNFNGAWYANVTGWWTALILFLLMAGVQIMSMLLPRIIQKRALKNVAKTGANPAQTDQQRTMKMMSIVMVGFTIVMGFMLPSAMGIYWLISGLLTMTQTLITQVVLAKKRAGKDKK